MSADLRRRDTLKLASAMAALGAGLGVLLEKRDAAAADPVKGPLPPPVRPTTDAVKLDSAAQIRIAAYQNVKIDKGFVQFKFYSGAGQFLYAANMPEEIARTLGDGTVLQFKFFRPGSDQFPASAPFAQSQAAPLRLLDAARTPTIKP